MTRRFVGFGGSAGGGSGTVTNTGGALTANAVVLGAGGSDTKVSTGITTDGNIELDLGLNGGSGGILGLNGATSGKATFTAPAVAGTVTNSVVSTNALRLPAGTAALPALNAGGNAGINWAAGTSTLSLGAAGVEIARITGSPNLISLGAGTLGMANAISSATDVGISRQAAGLMAVGSSTAADETGLVRAANGVRVTGDITLTVNTAITIFSFSLPALAKAWGWQAVIPWIISAGSGTNTISVGVNYTQTPTGTTGAQARIVTTNSPVAEIAGYVPLSATGATNILTSGTITPGASLLQAYCSGTLLASATAGTFTITMTAAGTTATALAKAGATCWFY